MEKVSEERRKQRNEGIHYLYPSSCNIIIFDQNKYDWMGCVCGMHEGKGKCLKNFSEKN